MKLVSINIEGHRHLHERVLPFLEQEQPDVVCLQEVFEVDVPVIAEALGMQSFFQPMVNVTEPTIHVRHALGVLGVAQFTKLLVREQQAAYYVDLKLGRLPIFFENGNPNSMNRVLVWQTVEKDGQLFTIATTHFTWSTRGESTLEQLRDLGALQRILDTIPEFVVCGDFNAPRGNETFARLAERYTDNIPPEVTTSIDGEFHKAGQLELMVDGLFSTPEYVLSQVQVLGGVSDHKAISAIINRS